MVPVGNSSICTEPSIHAVRELRADIVMAKLIFARPLRLYRLTCRAYHSALSPKTHNLGACDTDIDVDEATLRRARRAYHGTITDIDAKIEELLQALDESGFADNTIVMFTSDNRDMLGERGMWFQMSFFKH